MIIQAQNNPGGALWQFLCYYQGMESVSASLQAIERNFDRLARSAERVSRAADNQADRRSQQTQQTQQSDVPAQTAEPVDLAAERVEQLNVRRSTEAQVKFLRTADEMLGLILDLKA